MEYASSAETTEQRAKRYQRARLRLSLCDLGLSVAFVLALLFAGWSVALRDFAWQRADNDWMAVLIYALLLGACSKLLSFPLDFYSSYTLEHRYGLSNRKPSDWWKDFAKSLLIGAAFGLGAIEILYYTLRRFPDNWWLLCWAFFALFSILMANLAPVLLFPLFYKFRPLTDEALKNRLVELSRRAGARVKGVMEWKLSAKSKKANAALIGLGNTRRIILADNLLNQYSPEEIEAILAHELAHHVHNHIWKGIGFQLALSLAAFAFADQALQHWGTYFGYRNIADFANFPLLLMVSMVLSLMALPIANAFSRRNERQADEFALRMISDISPFISSMKKLANQNLADRQPHPLIEFLFHSHPSIEKRIRRAEQFHRAA
ncbi:MAG: M48 family metallopeptidase [Acidobacteria bacterium]|nr:M48 family metallopeptidase [Acidobacteriota bacterium]